MKSREGLGNPRGQSRESRLELGLRIRCGFLRANDLDCGRACYGKRFIMRGDEIRTVFVELQSAIHEFAVSVIA
jgi:hypothetical protein